MAQIGLQKALQEKAENKGVLLDTKILFKRLINGVLYLHIGLLNYDEVHGNGDYSRNVKRLNAIREFFEKEYGKENTWTKWVLEWYVDREQRYGVPQIHFIIDLK